MKSHINSSTKIYKKQADAGFVMKYRYFDLRFVVGIFIILVLLFYFYGPVSEHLYALDVFYLFLGLTVLLGIIVIKQVKWRLLVGKSVAGGWL